VTRGAILVSNYEVYAHYIKAFISYMALYGAFLKILGKWLLRTDTLNHYVSGFYCYCGYFTSSSLNSQNVNLNEELHIQ